MEIKPTRLFKYQSPSLQALQSLKAETLFFSSPKKFNDPYDCAMAPKFKFPTSEQISEFRNSTFVDEKISFQARQELSNFNDYDLALFLLRRARVFFNEQLEEFSAKKGICCFSEKNDNLLMWSHYAQGGSGFCVEFDTQYQPFNKVNKVIYDKEVPLFDSTQFILNTKSTTLMKEDFSYLNNFFCGKSIDWEYEAEWRIIHSVAETVYKYQPVCLKAVYFGTETTKEFLEIVCLILQGQNEHVKFFKARRNESMYRLDFDEFQYNSKLKNQLQM